MIRCLVTALMRLATWHDVGLVVVVIDPRRGKTGLLGNLNALFPQGDAKVLMLDTLRTAISIVKGDIKPSE